MKIIGGCVRSGPNFAAALLRSARLGGNTAMLLRAVLSAQADRVSAALGTRSGVEMRAGRRAAERAGAQIVLGECCLPVGSGDSDYVVACSHFCPAVKVQQPSGPGRRSS